MGCTGSKAAQAVNETAVKETKPVAQAAVETADKKATTNEPAVAAAAAAPKEASHATTPAEEVS